jgi:hypothetical protein
MAKASSVVGYNQQMFANRKSEHFQQCISLVLMKQTKEWKLFINHEGKYFC